MEAYGCASFDGCEACISGADGGTADSEGPAMWILYLLLFINPFLSASGTIAMRQMKKFSDAIVAWYQNISIMLSSLIIIFIQGSGFEIYKHFDWGSWVLMVSCAITSVFGTNLRFKALKF